MNIGKFDMISLKLIFQLTQFRVFGGGWVQSTTFLSSFSFHDFFGFYWLICKPIIGDKETYKTF